MFDTKTDIEILRTIYRLGAVKRQTLLNEFFPNREAYGKKRLQEMRKYSLLNSHALLTKEGRKYAACLSVTRKAIDKLSSKSIEPYPYYSVSKNSNLYNLTLFADLFLYLNKNESVKLHEWYSEPIIVSNLKWHPSEFLDALVIKQKNHRSPERKVAFYACLRNYPKSFLNNLLKHVLIEEQYTHILFTDDDFIYTKLINDVFNTKIDIPKNLFLAKSFKTVRELINNKSYQSEIIATLENFYPDHEIDIKKDTRLFAPFENLATIKKTRFSIDVEWGAADASSQTAKEVYIYIADLRQGNLHLLNQVALWDAEENFPAGLFVFVKEYQVDILLKNTIILKNAETIKLVLNKKLYNIVLDDNTNEPLIEECI